MIPASRRSSGVKANPSAIACAGELIDTVFPSTVILPESGLSIPNSRRAISVLPEPSSPARPTTSPREIVMSTGPTDPVLVSPLTLTIASPSSVGAAVSDRTSIAATSCVSFPIIRAISSIRGRSAVRYSPTS